MPTNEERRRVAAALRSWNEFFVCVTAKELGLWCEMFDDCCECEKALMDSLADLIDPEERSNDAD